MLIPSSLQSQHDNLTKIQTIVCNSANQTELYKNIANAPFTTLLPVAYELGTIVLLIENKSTGYIERVALSQTPAADGAVRASAVPFEAIRIPRNYKSSSHVKALETKKPVVVTDWYSMFAPALTAEQARDNQNGAGISTSVVYPFFSNQNGTIIFSLYSNAESIPDQAYQFFKWYSVLVSKCLKDLNTVNSMLSEN